MSDIHETFFLETYFGQKPSDQQLYHLRLMKQAVLCYYGTAYLMVAKIRYHEAPYAQDSSKLPNSEIFLRRHIKNSSSSITPENIQEFGMVLLNQALRNIKHL